MFPPTTFPRPSFSFLVVHFRRSLGPEKGVNHNSSAVLCAEKSGSSFGRVVVGPRIEHQQGVELSFEMAPKDTGLGRYGRAHAHLQPKVVRSFWRGGRPCWVWVSNHHITNGCNILRCTTRRYSSANKDLWKFVLVSTWECSRTFKVRLWVRLVDLTLILFGQL